MASSNTIREFIQDQMLIDDPTSGRYVPFHFRKPQNYYYDTLVNDYGSQWWFEDVDELNLKVRKLGFTSFWLACFAAIMILYKDPRRYLEISYNLDSTSQHFRRMRGFLLSPICKDPEKWNEKFMSQIFSVHTEGSEMVLKENGASFFVGTATSRTGKRGGTVQGVLFSEAAHYPDTTIITASEVIEATRQMVQVDSGIKVCETTGNGFNHFRRRWIQAVNGEISARPRFFGYELFYTKEQIEKIEKGFSDKEKFKQEYPRTANEAFLTSGRPVFSSEILKKMEIEASDIIFQGDLVDDAKTIDFISDKEGPLKIWKKPREGRRYLIASDIAGGVTSEDGLDPKKAKNRCWSVGAVFDRNSWEVVAEIRLRCDPDTFGEKLDTLGEFYNWAVQAPELNNMGQATLAKLKSNGYPHIVKADEFGGTKGMLGFPTDARTNVLTLTCLRNAINDEVYKENSLSAIDEMYEAVFNESGDLSSGGWLDCVRTRMIGLYCLKFYGLDDTYRHKTNADSPIVTTSMVGESIGSRERFRRRRQLAAI